MYTTRLLIWCFLPTYRSIYCNRNWYLETHNCMDVNPNSNGTLSPKTVVTQAEFIQNSFLVSKPNVRGKKGGSIHTRNIKKFANCVNACSTKEQEELLSDTLSRLHLDIMAMSNKGNSQALETNEGSIASLAPVEKANSYKRQKPTTSPSRYKR